MDKGKDTHKEAWEGRKGGGDKEGVGRERERELEEYGVTKSKKRWGVIV